jgi:hypothetical protein
MGSANRRHVFGTLVGFVVMACGGGAKQGAGPLRAGDRASAHGVSAGSGAPPPGSGLPLDQDLDYPDKTQTLYLSGKGTDDAVDWEFMINTGRRAGEPSTIPVPSNWEFHGFGDFQYGFNASTEVGTYRRTFELPASWARKRIFVVFEGAMTDTLVSVNDVSAGPAHQGGFYRFRYDVTRLVHPGSNRIQAVVSKQSANASVNAAEREADYWTFGGLFRPVYLEAYPPQSIERFAVDARADGSLKVNVQLRGLASKGRVTARVLDERLAPVGEPLVANVPANAGDVTLSGKLSGVRPWSAEAPHRYRLAVELEPESGPRHAVRDNFGFRTVEVRAGDGIYVNGTRVVLRGVNRHSFWPQSGRALSSALTLADVQLLKDMNMNAVRNSHYPADRHFFDHADALGLFVLDELAGWQTPPYDTAVGQKLVAEMVTFDVNHPSILFWDNGNEGGWNTALDTEFARWDPQNRPVLHPWATFSNVNTDHYESYASTANILGRDTLFMPTEFLHGFYDGGGGAGLDDYWKAMVASPRGAGGFLWAFVDEGVARAPGQIDTAGTAAPDGILGPYREKEGSYYAVRQIWSPVQIAEGQLTSDDARDLTVVNRYDATNLDTVTFTWQLARFDFHAPGGGHTVVSAGTARTSAIAPGASGTLRLELPPNRQQAHALLLDATDRSGRLIGKWSWMLATPSALRAGIVPATSSAAAVATDAGKTWTVTASGTTFEFAKSDGKLLRVSAGGQQFALANGPSLSVGSATLRSFAGAPDGNDYVLRAQYAGDLREVTWRVLGNGWLSLHYAYHLSGSYDFFGVDFDCPEAQVQGVEWLGRGPTRVWKNRMRGPWHDWWSREKNDAVTGQLWDYPEFKGYFADVAWARLRTAQGPIEVVVDSPGLFLRLYTPRNGPSPQHAAMSFPARDISFLHGIAPIGDKFLAPAELGPQGQKHALDGDFEATLYFHFGPSAP